MRNGFDRVDHDIRELRGEVGALRDEMHAEIGSLRTGLGGEIAELRHTMNRFGAGIMVALAGVIAALLGVVGAILTRL